jgi:hypothetical protein
MSENEEPDWLAELAKGGEAIRQQVEPIVQAALQFARLDWPKASTGPGVPLPLRLAAAVDAAMRELLPPPEPVVHQISLPGTITVSGSLALRPMRFVGDAEVVTAPEGKAVQAPQPRRGLAALSDGEIVALVLVWLYAVWLPWFGSRLPPELHGMLSDSLATFAIALAITWRIRDKHK